jgi:integrase
VDLRDSIVLRLGLLGMRRAEITKLTVAVVSDLPRIVWTGKGRRIRRATAGETLCALLTTYLDLYRRHHPALNPCSPLICPAKGSFDGEARVRWAVPAGRDCVYRIIRVRAEAAGLGHLSPHDLRRTAAGLLHNAKSGDGGHRFDLLDIQRVLGHADPATTMRCYLEPLDTGVLDRAARVLD